MCSLALLPLAACGPDGPATETESNTTPGETTQGEPTDGGGVPQLEATLEWSWTTDGVTVVPLVADIQGDATPEVVVVTAYGDGSDRDIGDLVVLNGATGAELWRISERPEQNSFGALGSATPVLADVNGDGRPDIIYAGRLPAGAFPTGTTRTSLVHAVDGTGKPLWTGHDAEDAPVEIIWDKGAAAAANLDDDPEAEIAIGGALFDNDGRLVWNEGDRSGLLGSPTDNREPQARELYAGGLPTFADLDGDDRLELITGREAWTIRWIAGDPPDVSMELLWRDTSGEGNDGWPAIGDIDQNGTPEVVLVAWPDIKVLDGRTGELWCGVDPSGTLCAEDGSRRTRPIAIEGGNLGGPATIADFDGDGRPEVGIAGGAAYAVYDFHRDGEELVVPAGDASPMPGAIFPRWVATTQDHTSACTGSSVFDFQGDGAAEVVYQDECKVYIYDGKTGIPQLELPNSSSTVHEYPLVVDVDGDGRAELLTVANLSEVKPNASCKQKDPDFAPRAGVYAYGAAMSDWVPTRKLWTQHTYHVTNAQSDGNVPLLEQPNWSAPGLNNFRQNVQGAK